MFERGSEKMEPRSGDKNLDRALAQGLATIAREFEVLPAFTYYDDSDEPNARATSERLLNRADGTVLFGLEMLRMLKAKERPDAAILAVCAHEFGHILSYKNGMDRQLSPDWRKPFRSEQFADYMAGYYAGRRKLLNKSYPAAAFAETQYGFGGGDHGTRKQRGDAVQQGFLTAFQQRLTGNDAIQAAFRYAMAQVLK